MKNLVLPTAAELDADLTDSRQGPVSVYLVLTTESTASDSELAGR
ncbi:hypothetical protein [Amycolatopsis sp. CA-230715]|nr:hypothetical protein [Amycolatopsis sp. CA-230715]QWF85984.1 hypothetical protein HUW46_09465 [Amycolatopsis sp. CA-230715]